MARLAHCQVLACLSFLSGCLVVTAFRNGDFIQSARKAQFHSQRTHWHDLVGEACPRFGRDRLVVVMLPKPVAPEGAQTVSDDYKIQLSFDGDRHLTHWLKLAGKGAPTVPVVHVTLKRSGDELLGVYGQVSNAPMHMQHQDSAYVSQWRNSTHWPKRLLLSYKWDTHNDIDLDRGLAVLMIIGLLVGILLVFNAAIGAGPKLAQFLTDIASDLSVDDMAAVPGTSSGRQGTSALASIWKGGGKAE